MTRPFPEVPGVDVEHSYVQARRLRFHVAQAGPAGAPPLVLLHGWPQHWFEWRKVLPALSQHYRVHMPDLRGFGWSDAPPGGYEKENLADDMFAVLDALGLERVQLLAHDWGGWTAFLMALREPQRIERYVALNIPPPFAGGRHNPRAALSFWRVWYQVVLATPLGPRFLARPASLARALRADNVQPGAFSDADAESFAAALREPARARASMLLYRTFLTREALRLRRYDQTPLRVPTLLLYGQNDRAVAQCLVTGATRPGDTLRYELVPDSGHFIAEEKPQLVAERTLAFFAE